MHQFRSPVSELVRSASSIVLGKEREIRLAISCLLARGHLLIEDLPGVGKTTLAHALARLLGLQFQRVQFTSDLLPADILGVSIFEREHSAFRFVPGPIFSQLVLADEINRATPKTQSALLEAMEERQVTVEGETRPLPNPFFVIATQNPSHQIGTFPLPESQLDRFMMRIELGYPDPAAERKLLGNGDTRLVIDQTPVCVPAEQLPTLQAQVQGVICAPALIDYVQTLLAATRHHSAFAHGLSPRAGLAMLSAARAWAYVGERNFVLPEDIQAVFPAVAGHRLRVAGSGAPVRAETLAALLSSVAIP
jgi:MoxR-like ATPase